MEQRGWMTVRQLMGHSDVTAMARKLLLQASLCRLGDGGWG